jgi:hypothetical protein
VLPRLRDTYRKRVKKVIFLDFAVIAVAAVAGAITLTSTISPSHPSLASSPSSTSSLKVIDSSGSVLTGEERQSLFNGFVERLSDPVSAQVKNLARSTTAGMVCGEVNAKNRMGAYVGFVPFIAGVTLPKAIIVMPSRDVVERMPEEVRAIQAKRGCPAT